ncbi:BamA/TamA family outer membrane protein [bacterium]|nr:BamA/TamA family outer membrane protein [bacterium]
MSGIDSVDTNDLHIEIPPLARSITFQGNTAITTGDLLQASGLKSGQLINGDVLNKAIDAVQAAYQDRGYIAAVTSIDLPKPGQVGTLTMTITELRITAIRFEGLSKVRESAVRRVLTVKTDDLFSREAITRDYVQLQQLGVFAAINSDMEPTQQMGQAILIWKFDEQTQFNYADLGGSYSPQDSLIGSVKLTFGNLGGKAQKLLVSGEMGSVESQAGGRIEYFNPWIAPDNTSLKLDVFSLPYYRFSRDLSGTGRYFERRSGFKAAVSHMPEPSLTLTRGLRFENVVAKNLPTSEMTDPTLQSGSLLLASLKAAQDYRNSSTNPTCGTYTLGFFESGWSDQGTGGDSMIGKLWADRRWYIPLRAQTVKPGAVGEQSVPVLALRAMLAGSAGSLPYYEQYFVGGIGDMPLRGYLEGRYWGKYAMLANAEIRYPFTRDIWGVAFVDTGSAWGSEFQYISGITTQYSQSKHFSPRAGAGFGVRYNSPYGQMSVDFAYGDAFRTYFSVGQLF